jgi:levanase/fructan beta-fructosidase
MWHEATGKWIMVLWLDDNDYTFYGSKNLKEWKHLCDVAVPGAVECPDFFPLAADGDADRVKWVLWGGPGVYCIGSFDGTVFTPQSDSLKCELGANGYAAQTWSDVPPDDGRRIQISWMANGKHPCMPFNGQMSFPVELSLRSCPEGLRLCRQPVREIGLIHDVGHNWRDETVAPGTNLVPPSGHDLFHIEAEVDVGKASGFGLIIRGHRLQYDSAAMKFTCLGKDIPVWPEDGALAFEVLVDRTSIELFAEGGKVSASFCYLPEAWNVPLEFYAIDKEVTFCDLAVHELKSSWLPPTTLKAADGYQSSVMSCEPIVREQTGG